MELTKKGQPDLFLDNELLGDGNKRDPERESWPCSEMLPILPIQSISGSRLFPSPGISQTNFQHHAALGQAIHPTPEVVVGVWRGRAGLVCPSNFPHSLFPLLLRSPFSYVRPHKCRLGSLHVIFFV